MLEWTFYSVWVDLLYFGYFLSLHVLCGCTREWIYCILNIVHMLEWTVQLCKLFEYFYTDVLCDWISKSSQDQDISCYQRVNRSQNTDICVSVDWSQDRSQDRLLDTVDKCNSQLQWPGQTGFIIVSLYMLLRAYQLIMLFLIVK